MKKLLLILSIGLISCLEPNVGYPGTTHQTSTDSVSKDTSYYPKEIKVEFSSVPLNVVLIDSCEYLYGPWGNGTVLCHKGNCKNKQHERNTTTN